MTCLCTFRHKVSEYRAFINNFKSKKKVYDAIYNVVRDVCVQSFFPQRAFMRSAIFASDGLWQGVQNVG